MSSFRAEFSAKVTCKAIHRLKMSQNDTPSWLTDDAVADAGTKLAKNPAVQKAAVKAAKDPRVQKAATDAAMKKLNNDPTWANAEDEQVSAGDVEANMAPQVCDCM